jgi:transposase
MIRVAKNGKTKYKSLGLSVHPDQRYYNLSDDQIEFQINDRLSFMRFLDLTISDDIPDSCTVWNFREHMTDLGVVEELFALFLNQLNTLGLIIIGLMNLTYNMFRKLQLDVIRG